MRDMNDFMVPQSGMITLCEIDGRTQCMEHEYVNLSTFTTAVEKHAKIHITRDLLHPATSGDEGRALFLPVNVSFLKQLTQVYYEQGFLEALHTAACHNQVAISKSASLILNVLDNLTKLRIFLNPNINYRGVSTINEYSQTRNWLNSSVRCLAWHPHCSKIAICTSDDSVRIYSQDGAAASYVLRCKQQKNVTCLAWRPFSILEIAVGHENGVIVWNIDPNSLVSRPSISNAIVLNKIDHTPVMSLTWSPRGDLLASAAICDNVICVWDVELNKTECLKRAGSVGNVIVKWSPSGEKLFSCSNGIVFRVWDCKNWQCEKWTILSGRVQAACWTHCGSHVLFATTSEPLIYSLKVKNDLVFASDVETSNNQAIPLYDLSKIDVNGVLIGGMVQSMEIDPSGNHLAVLFHDTNCVAVFNIARRQPLELIASSLVSGLSEEIPTCIAFENNFEGGANLTIGWSSGRVQYFPIIYTDLAENADICPVDRSVQNLTYSSIQPSFSLYDKF